MSSPSFRRVLTNVAMIVLLATAFAACNKEEPTTAIIHVKMPDGTPVPGATVKLFGNPAYPLADPTRLNKETSSNSSGKAEFDYTDFYKKGQSGFAVLDIECRFDTLIGEGIIKIIEEETNEETVYLVPVQ